MTADFVGSQFFFQQIHHSFLYYNMKQNEQIYPNSMIQQKKDGSGKLNRFLIIFEPNPKYLKYLRNH